MTITKINYHPEIDGLRAIAVLSVVFYHAGFEFKAGYVGVDIFFVISGYLITSLLLKEWYEFETINFASFYARRVRRILPAVIAVILFTLIAVSAMPPNIESTTNFSATSALLFGANIFFQATTGDYFDDRSDEMPLLHLWSLSVEEQFYFVWPLVLMLILRHRPNRLLPILGCLALISFLTAEWLIPEDTEVAFYQMPARFWELALGGIIATLPSVSFASILALAGFIMIALSVAFPIGHFPGAGAVPTVIGTTLLIYAIHAQSRLGIIGTLLRFRPMVFLGLISYSLYLWHWPLLVLYHATIIGSSSLSERLGLCCIAIIFAFLSYRYIELPFRKSHSTTQNTKTMMSCLCLSTVMAIGTLFMGHRVKPDNVWLVETDYPPNRKRCHYTAGDKPADFPRKHCESNPNAQTRIAIWGDSLALAWQPLAWTLAKKEHLSAIGYSRDACPPLAGYISSINSRSSFLCRDFNTLVIEHLKGMHTVILAASWHHHFMNQNMEAAQHGLKETLAQIAPVVNKIILLGPTPELREKVPRCMRANALNECVVSRNEFETSTNSIRYILQSLAMLYPNVEYVELADFFCTSTVCPGLKDGYALYWDNFHISSTAAKKFAEGYVKP